MLDMTLLAPVRTSLASEHSPQRVSDRATNKAFALNYFIFAGLH